MIFEVDAVAQPGQEAKWRLESFQSRVRKSHAVTNTCRPEVLAFGDLLRDIDTGGPLLTQSGRPNPSSRS